MERSSEQQSLLPKAVELVLLPFRKATSKTAQRAYLGTFFLFAASVLLFGISSVAYILFYYSYVPQIGVTRPIHLQFGHGQHPHGNAQLSSSLVSQQAYDISVSLHLPRTPNNLAVGNFMVDLALIAPQQPGSSTVERIQSTLGSGDGFLEVVTSSSRPAILTYASPTVDTAKVLLHLPWMLIGWKKESETLKVAMFEGVRFAKGWKNVPNQVNLVIKADREMQVYEANVHVRAQFRGLRWIMYNHRIASFLFFTSTFFGVSLTGTFVVYVLFSLYTSSSEQGEKEAKEEVKQEQIESEPKPYNPLSTSDLSDTARTFPTTGRQRPLQFVRGFSEDTKIKQEEAIEESAGIEPLVAEADDEEDTEDDGNSTWRDSGIGTGREERGRSNVQKRRISSQDR